MAEDNKSLFKHFIYVGTGTIISMIIGIITTPIITRLYLPDEYGQYSMFLTYGELIYITLGFGMDQALARFYYDNPSNEYKISLVKKCIRVPMFFGIFLQVLVIFLVVKGIFFGGGQDSAVVMLGTFYVVILILNRFLSILLRLENRTKIYGFIGVFQKITFFIIVLGIYFLIGVRNAIGLCIGALISQLASMVVGFWGDKDILQCRKKYNEEMLSQKELFLYAFPFVFSVAISSLFQTLDRLFVKEYCGYYEVGIYSSAMSIIHIFAIIQTSFTTIWIPNAIKKYSESKENKEYYSEMSKMMAFLMFFLGVLLIVFKDIIIFMLGEKYREAAGIIPFLVYVPIMYTISETTVVGLVFMKKSSWQIIPPSIACVVNFIGNYLLVPIFGGKGAAVSTGISYIVFLYARTFLSNKCYFIDFGLKKMIFITLITIGYAIEVTFFDLSVISICFGIILLCIIALTYREQMIRVMQLGRKYFLRCGNEKVQ